MPTRFKPLSQHDMTLDQRRVAQAVASGPRGGLRGPFPALLRSPELADRVRQLGDYVPASRARCPPCCANDHSSGGPVLVRAL